MQAGRRYTFLQTLNWTKTYVLVFVVLFIALLPFGMINVFSRAPEAYWIWLSIPISTIARSIEIDIRQMLDETDLPKPLEPMGDFYVLM